MKKAIAEEVARIQVAAQKLPAAAGYGFAYNYDDQRLRPSWHDVIGQQLVRARRWITKNGLCDTAHVDRVESRLPSVRDYFDEVAHTIPARYNDKERPYFGFRTAWDRGCR